MGLYPAPAIEKIYNDGFEISFPTITSITPAPGTIALSEVGEYRIYLDGVLFKSYPKGTYRDGYDISSGAIPTTFIQVSGVPLNYFAAPIQVVYATVIGGGEFNTSTATTLSTNYSAAASLATTNETTILAAVPNLRLDLVKLTLSNGAGSDASVTIRDATAGSTVYGPIYLAAAGGGDEAPFSVVAPLRQTTANKNWTAQSTVAGVKVFMQAVADLT
jgi:hypothetical protein